MILQTTSGTQDRVDHVSSVCFFEEVAFPVLPRDFFYRLTFLPDPDIASMDFGQSPGPQIQN